MHISYCPVIENNLALLSAEESAHCIRVLRMDKGDKIQIIDGKGGYYEAVIAHPDAKQCRVAIISTVPVKPHRNFSVHVAIAPTKNMDRFEWFVEKSVEIGVNTITPLLCQHSERRIINAGRLEKLIISTIKQAIIPLKPVLNDLIPFQKFIDTYSNSPEGRFIAHCASTEKRLLCDVRRTGSDSLILIGPEGDFSSEEIQFAINNGFLPVSLGNNRLRTETAGIVACCQMTN